MKFKDGKFQFEVDTNKDGQPVIAGKLNMNEAVQEAFKRGEAIEGAKVVSMRFELTKLILIVDTDKDGESLLELEIDLPEGFDEISSAISK